MQKLSVYSIIVLLGIAAGGAVLMTVYNPFNSQAHAFAPQLNLAGSSVAQNGASTSSSSTSSPASTNSSTMTNSSSTSSTMNSTTTSTTNSTTTSSSTSTGSGLLSNPPPSKGG